MKIRWLPTLFFIFIVVLLVLVTPIFLAKQGYLSVSDFIKLLTIIFSLPTAILIITLSFFSRFHDAIESLLKNIGSMKLPGGFEFQRQNPTPPIVKGEIKVLPEISESKKLPDNEKQHSELVNSVRYWKFSYLNQFFVLQTKNVLSWFSRSTPQTRQAYDIIWTPYIPDQNQRNLILSVLLQNGMVSEKDGSIRITEEGLSFLQFIGSITTMPSSQTV
jgi:hypothetical protein